MPRLENLNSTSIDFLVEAFDVHQVDFLVEAIRNLYIISMLATAIVLVIMVAHPVEDNSNFQFTMRFTLFDNLDDEYCKFEMD